MFDMRKLLMQAAEITKRRIAVIKESDSVVYPGNFDLGITFEEASQKVGKNFKGFNIYLPDTTELKYFVCISSDSYFESETTRLVLLLLGSAIENGYSVSANLKKAVEGKYDAAELAKLEEDIGGSLPGYLLLIEGYGDSEEDVLEILTNSMDIKMSYAQNKRIIAVADEENITEACSGFIKNVLSELLIECRLVIGGSASKAAELKGLYDNCVEALCLRHIYSLGDNLLNYDGLYGYRIAYNLDPKLKGFILNRVFTAEFKEMMNSELGTTIEEFFKNNLNLTDTAAKLYIHRNTLLYRLDKILKSTGFDLKRFEDSWLFKLAWMIYKENL